MEQNLKLIEMDNVNEGWNGEPSSGRGAHDLQVTLDRHQATADNCKRKSKVKPVQIATWNVRTLYQSGKLDNIKKEME